MSKRRITDDGFEATDSGLWVPKHGLRAPNRRTLDSRRFSPGYPCGCRGEGCFLCDDDYGGNFLVTIADLSTGDGECDECTDLNDDYIATRIDSGNCSIMIGESGPFSWGCCKWKYTFDPVGPCDVEFVLVEFIAQGFSETFRYIRVTVDSVVQFREDEESWPDCGDFDDEDIDLNWESNECFDGTTPTCTLTAL